MKWGIIGAGNIAHRFAQSQSFIEGSCIQAISARNEEKRRKFAQEFSVAHACATPEEVLEDAQVEAVYIALPHHLHYTWCRQALLHHKAVLCEKPLCLHAEEMQELVDLAKEKQVLLMEGMKSLFTDAYTEFRKKDLQNIEEIHVSTGFVLPPSGRGYPVSKECGGCLYDMGIYALGLLSDLCTGDMLIDSVHTDRKYGVDFEDDFRLTIGNCKVHMLCSFEQSLSKAEIKTPEETLELSPVHRPLFLNGKEYPYTVDDFHGEIQHFVDLYSQHKIESPIVTFESMVRHITWMEELHECLSEEL